ncbi:hypothetical protein ACLB2K_007019 [Fragaria x ananassa]
MLRDWLMGLASPYTVKESCNLKEHAISAAIVTDRSFLHYYEDISTENDLPVQTVGSKEDFQLPSQSQYIQGSIYPQS